MPARCRERSEGAVSRGGIIDMECIGKGKANAPYEFAVKVSIATTNARAPGGQFVSLR